MTARAPSLCLRALESVFLGMIAVLPVAFYLGTYDGVTLKSTLFQLGTLTLAVCWVLKGILMGRWAAPRPVWPLLAPGAALLAWTVLRFATAPFHLAALPQFLEQALFLTTYCLVLLELGGADTVRRLIDWMLLLAAVWVVCGYGNLQFLGLDPVSWKEGSGERVFSTLLNPDAFGSFLAITLPFALTRMLDPESSSWALAFDLVLLPLLGLAVLASGSAEGLIALLVQAVVFMGIAALALPLRAAWLPILAAGLLAIGVLKGADAMGPGIEQNLVYETEFKSQAWSGTLDLIAEKPWIGHGPGSFAVHFPRFRPPALIRMEGAHNTMTTHPESQLLQVAAELGWLGVALFLWLFGALLAAAAKAQRAFVRQGALRESGFTVALGSAVAGFLVSGQLGVGSQFLIPGWLLWALAGLLGGLTLLAGNDQTVAVLPLPMRGPERRTLAGPVIMAALGLAAFPLLWFRSDLELKRAVEHARAAEMDQALEHYRRVLPGAPSYVMAQYFIAITLLDLGKPEEALRACAHVESMAPDYVQLHHVKGRAYARLGDWENAIASYQRSALLDPLFVGNYLALAESQRAAGDLAAARRAALSAIALEPQEPEHWRSLAQIYMKEKRLAASRNMQRQAARLAKR